MQLQMFIKGHLITNAQSDTRNNENDDLISYLINSYTYLKKCYRGERRMSIALFTVPGAILE